MQMFSVCAVQHSSHWHCKWGACDCGPQFLILILFDLNSHVELVIYCVGQCRSKSEYQFIYFFQFIILQIFGKQKYNSNYHVRRIVLTHEGWFYYSHFADVETEA